jgi:hypothetical protein
MTVLLMVLLVAAVLYAVAWWTSGRSKKPPIDPGRALLRSDAYSQSMQNQTRFDPGGPLG